MLVTGPELIISHTSQNYIPKIAFTMYSYDEPRTGPINGMPNKTNANINIKPYASILSIKFCRGSGAKAYKTLDPSNGGIGNILNKKKPTFIFTKYSHQVIQYTSFISVTRKIIPPIIAKNRLVSGPATATNAIPNSPHLSRCLSTGTGLAAPNIGCPNAAKTTGNATVAIGSICGTGFYVSRPSSSAVVSPKYLAT